MRSRRAAAQVSVIVSALNEAGTIEPALRSLLALQYPKLEIFAAFGWMS